MTRRIVFRSCLTTSVGKVEKKKKKKKREIGEWYLRQQGRGTRNTPAGFHLLLLISIVSISLKAKVTLCSCEQRDESILPTPPFSWKTEQKDKPSFRWKLGQCGSCREARKSCPEIQWAWSNTLHRGIGSPHSRSEFPFWPDACWQIRAEAAANKKKEEAHRRAMRKVLRDAS